MVWPNALGLDRLGTVARAVVDRATSCKSRGAGRPRREDGERSHIMRRVPRRLQARKQSQGLPLFGLRLAPHSPSQPGHLVRSHAALPRPHPHKPSRERARALPLNTFAPVAPASLHALASGLFDRCSHMHSLQVMPCGHPFHFDCIMEWLERHNQCPMCRFQLPSEQTTFDLQSDAVARNDPTGTTSLYS